MCLVVYLAASKPLPELPWNPAEPAFHVQSRDDGAARVRGQMTLPHVYYVGSHEGCGCGFDQENGNPGHPEELAATRASLDALARYLRAAVLSHDRLELYTCWDGDEELPVEHRLRVQVGSFAPDMTWFPERAHVTIVRDAAA